MNMMPNFSIPEYFRRSRDLPADIDLLSVTMVETILESSLVGESLPWTSSAIE
ncbi:hypothetical protein ACFQL4_09560 [Halosimplex aquaticum]